MKKIICIALLLSMALSVPVQGAARPVQRLPVLLYHHLLPRQQITTDNAFIAAAEDFEAHMKYLYENGYSTVTLAELRSFLFDKKPLPEKSVMITFDDGYYSNIMYAYPVLKEYGFTAVIFLITRNAGNAPPLTPKPGDLIPHALMEGTLDVFEYATHTHDMHTMVQGKSLLARASHADIVADITESLNWVSNTFALAYPHGQTNDTVISAAKEAGMEMAFAITHGYVRMNSDPFRLHRFVVYQSTTLERIKSYLAAAR
jgi:peptidoglycan/xylan/chitin deacetylase (PgdA/CDA1 family)